LLLWLLLRRNLPQALTPHGAPLVFVVVGRNMNAPSLDVCGTVVAQNASAWIVAIVAVMLLARHDCCCCC